MCEKFDTVTLFLQIQYHFLPAFSLRANASGISSLLQQKKDAFPCIFLMRHRGFEPRTT